MKRIYVLLVFALMAHGANAHATERYDDWGMWAEPVSLAALFPSANLRDTR